MQAAVGEYRQPKCYTFSNPQLVETVQQWADVVATTGGKYQSRRGILNCMAMLPNNIQRSIKRRRQGYGIV